MFQVFPRVVKPDVCEQIIEDCKQNILKEASELNPDKSSRDDPEVRKTSIHFIKDEDNKVNELAWHFLREANKIQFNYDLTYTQAVQFAEYSQGGHYSWHQDDIGVDKSNEIRKLSFGLALSNPDNFEGGEFQFASMFLREPMSETDKIDGEQVKKDIQAQGTVIVFDSRDFHRVTPIISGVRHSLVAWVVGPNFK